MVRCEKLGRSRASSKGSAMCAGHNNEQSPSVRSWLPGQWTSLCKQAERVRFAFCSFHFSFYISLLLLTTEYFLFFVYLTTRRFPYFYSSGAILSNSEDFIGVLKLFEMMSAIYIIRKTFHNIYFVMWAIYQGLWYF